jgi:F-type H+-transporting ATPase subunit alpha
VEILKQPQYQPLSMVKQVTILFAGTRGYLDKYPLDALADYEKQLYDFIEAQHLRYGMSWKRKRKSMTVLKPS